MSKIEFDAEQKLREKGEVVADFIIKSVINKTYREPKQRQALLERVATELNKAWLVRPAKVSPKKQRLVRGIAANGKKRHVSWG